MSFSHFVAQLTIPGGPPPSEELRRLIERSRSQPEHVAWFKSTFVGDGFEKAGNSICILFWKVGQGTSVEAVIARILPKHESGAGDMDDMSFYANWPKLTAWWPLGGLRARKNSPDIALTSFGSLDEVRGCQWENGNTAEQSFSGTATVAGWRFPDGFDTLAWIQGLATATN